MPLAMPSVDGVERVRLAVERAVALLLLAADHDVDVRALIAGDA